jgi:putative Mn2+ efflux pump MntP
MTTESIIGLVVLAFALSLDNFRSSIALGTVPFGVGRAIQIALVFGFWDAVAPLVGGEFGSYFGDEIGPVAEYIGPVLMGAYGLYLLVGALRHPEPEKVDHPWVTLFGMPLALSVDNLLAGTGLGLLGFSPVIPALIFGAATAVMSLVGLFVGRAAARVIPIRSDLLSGVSLLTAAVVLPLVFA